MDGVGYGFITPRSTKKDLFFHANELTNVFFGDLQAGDLVGFEIIEGSKGPVAVSVGRNGHPLDEEIDDEETPINEEVVAAIKTLSSKLVELIAKDPAALESIEWRDLERLVAEIFSGLGFDAELTPGSKDGGKDVIISFTVSNQNKSYLIEIKHWRSGSRVGRSVISEFLHVVTQEKRSGGLLLSTSGYSKNALEHWTEFDRQKIRFGTGEKVASLCRNYVKASNGTWYYPDPIEKVIFEDTV